VDIDGPDVGCDRYMDQRPGRFREIKSGGRLTGTGFGALFTRIDTTEKK
jgi:hypothetical protein